MTFSITARCPATGMVGVAVSTKLLCVGALVPFVQAGVGAVATQSFVNPYLGSKGVAMLATGMDAATVRDQLAAGDDGRTMRQFAVVDHTGNAAAYSGAECFGWFGHQIGDGFVAAGNMLTGAAVIQEMARAYEATLDEPFAERLMRALEAGQAAGGDKRGRQSAALKVAQTEEYPLIDLRVDDHADPVAELRRLWEVYQRELGPVMDMLPSKQFPAGRFDLEAIRQHLPQDD